MRWTLESEPMMDQELLRLDDLLRRVRRGIADLELSRERVQAQITALELQEEAQGHRGELDVQLDQVLAEEAKLTTAAQRLLAKKAIRQFGLDDQDGEP